MALKALLPLASPAAHAEQSTEEEQLWSELVMRGIAQNAPALAMQEPDEAEERERLRRQVRNAFLRQVQEVRESLQAQRRAPQLVALRRRARKLMRVVEGTGAVRRSLHPEWMVVRGSDGEHVSVLASEQWCVRCTPAPLLSCCLCAICRSRHFARSVPPPCLLLQPAAAAAAATCC